MSQECTCEGKCKRKTVNNYGGTSGALYGLGIFGAAYYFLQHAVGLVPVVIALIKSVFWPAFVVFKLMELLKV